MNICTMPGCTTPPTTINRAGQDVCRTHRAVVIADSWMGEGDNHLEPTGDSQ
ncbi:hypothetical protein [Nocardioides sp. J54]|uniref:hypothetical protein n=1 Tax=Nocardioides sp. J54 TaxID=935866 RepID=UPI0004B3C8E8|nr:hypothetical protein [Nocardioides sp. J54]